MIELDLVYVESHGAHGVHPPGRSTLIVWNDGKGSRKLRVTVVSQREPRANVVIRAIRR
jgi:hypothetical protein